MLPKLKIAHQNRFIKFALQGLLIIALYLAIKAYMQRDLIEGRVPVLQDMLLSGQTVDLQELQGQPVLLHFWATWCSICKLEEGSINAISNDHMVITVAMQSGNHLQVKTYLEENELSFPVVVDEKGVIAKRFGVTGVPTSFIIDANGNIAFTEVGYTTAWGLRFRLWLAQ